MRPEEETQLRQLIDQGFSIFPVVYKTKTPFYKTRGFYDATREWPQIVRWDEQYPKRHWAIRTGDASQRLIVVDLDVKNGKNGIQTWDKLCAEYEFSAYPDTPMVVTPSGGQHIYFRAPEGEYFKSGDDRTIGLGDGLDIKHTGGYVVAPPSEGYEFDYRAELMDLPDFLVEKLPRAGAPKDDPPPTSEDPHILNEHNRNTGLAKEAGRLRNMGYNQAELLEVLLLLNESRCNPPLEEKEVKTIAKSIARYAPGDEEFERRFRLWTAAEALLPQPPIEWLVMGLMERGTVNMYFGEPGALKTYSMLDMGVCVAMGKKWLDFETVQGNVLWVDEETGTGRILRRLHAILKGHLVEDNPPDLTGFSMAQLDLHDPDDINALHALIMQTDADLVIIDALVDLLRGRDENQSRDVGPILSALRSLAELTGATIVLIHHTNRANQYRGSSSIKGALDLMVHIKSEQGDNNITFEIEKTREASIPRWGAEIVFEQDQTWLKTADPESPLANLNERQRYIVKYMRSGNATIALLMKEVSAKMNCHPDTVRKDVYLLEDIDVLKCKNPDQRGRGKEAIYMLANPDI